MSPEPPSRAGWSRRRSRAGWRRTSPPSSPASGSPGWRSTAARARVPSRSAAASATSPTASTAPQAIHLRERPIPWAYRVFFRQIGLDPDRTRTPVEQLAFERIREGAFNSVGLPADALTIATVETGVALRAFDADRIDGALCIRDSAPGESLPGQPGELAQGTLTIADERAPSACSSATTGDGYAVEPATPAAGDRRRPGQRRAADRRRGGALDCRGDARGFGPDGSLMLLVCGGQAVIYTRTADAGSAHERAQRASRRGRRAPGPGRVAAPGRPPRA